MKALRLLLCFLFAGLASASAAEHLWDDFNDYPEGDLPGRPGWTSAAWLGTRPALVSGEWAWSWPRSVKLPWHADGTAAVFTNFVSTYTTNEHPVIRCSARLRLANTNTPFRIGLRNSAAGHFLVFTNTGGYGAFGFLYHDVVFVPLATGAFTDVTFFYNRSNNTYRLDYAFSNRLEWALADSDPVTHTQFNQFVAHRPGTGSDTNALYLDNVSVQTFPPHVWAWWRCDPVAEQILVEQTGAFYPGGRMYTFYEGLPGSSDPVWDGTADYRNAGACRQLVGYPVAPMLPTPASTNWTVEAAFRMPPDADNTTFLDWGTDMGFNTNGAYINFSYAASYTSLYINVRDAQQIDDDFQYILFGPFRPTGRWQHVAVVKSNATASLYVDYQLVTSRLFNATADGAYTFARSSWASLGQSLNQGNTSGPDTDIDEIRVSGKALAPAEFLQPGQPMIVAINNSPTNATWELTAKCILGKSYRLEAAAAPGPSPDWQTIPGSDFTSAFTFDFVDVTNTAPATRTIRLRRLD